MSWTSAPPECPQAKHLTGRQCSSLKRHRGPEPQPSLSEEGKVGESCTGKRTHESGPVT